MNGSAPLKGASEALIEFDHIDDLNVYHKALDAAMARARANGVEGDERRSIIRNQFLYASLGMTEQEHEDRVAWLAENQP